MKKALSICLFLSLMAGCLLTGCDRTSIAKSSSVAETTAATTATEAETTAELEAEETEAETETTAEESSDAEDAETTTAAKEKDTSKDENRIAATIVPAINPMLSTGMAEWNA